MISHFFAWVSTQFSLTIKAVQCDNGREFDNNASRSFFLSRGVQLRMSCPYTSTQNGKAERMIGTTNDVMCTLLFQASLPARFWAESLHTATYLLNRLPSTASPAPTPHHALFGTSPRYDHLCVFGCSCYPNTSATAPHKLAPRSTWCVFLGYSPDHKGYRCFDLISCRVLISWHVVFDESDFPFSTTSTPTSDLEFASLFPTDSVVHPPLSERSAGPPPVCSPDALAPLPVVTAAPCADLEFPAASTPLAPPPPAAPCAALAPPARYAQPVRVYQRRPEFAMKDLGVLHHFLGVTVELHPSGLLLHQRQYTLDILERAGMTDCNPYSTPVDTQAKLSEDVGAPVADPTAYRSLAGALQYLTFTRLDITYAVQQVCLHMHDPREPHLTALKRLLRYLRGTVGYSLLLHRSSSAKLVVYTDANWAGCPDTRRSTSGDAVFLGGNLVSWSSKRQPVVSRSGAEAKYRAVASGSSWLSFTARSPRALSSTATTSARFTSPPTRFSTSGPSTWRSTCTSSAIGSRSAIF
ncbi:hypothetical protein U9M48_027526, partial [Paspalum notatum var. saurae]